MAHIDVENRRFDSLTTLEDWRPRDPVPALFGFFIVSNPPEDWDTKGPTTRREILLATRDDLTAKISRAGGFEAWIGMWEQSLQPSECIAVGTCLMPGSSGFEIDMAASDLLGAGHFVEHQ